MKSKLTSKPIDQTKPGNMRQIDVLGLRCNNSFNFSHELRLQSESVSRKGKNPGPVYAVHTNMDTYVDPQVAAAAAGEAQQ